jgi:dTDP-4-dehydrorhamnose reductase
MRQSRRVVVTGASGLLGAHLVAALGAEDTVTGIDRHPWWGDTPATIVPGDLLDDAFVTNTIRDARPEMVIHCAALANVDRCEEEPALADRYNHLMTRTLAEAAGPECLFVYITTDGLFAGNRSFVTEDEPPQPRTVYARTKLAGERAVVDVTANHLILRTNFYGWSSGRKQTSGEWLIQALEAGQPMTLFDDFFFTPIYVADFVERIDRLTRTAHRGVFHLCGAERVSKYQFGATMGEMAGVSTAAVRRGSIDAAGLKAPRPKDMSLNCDRFRNAAGESVPDVRAGLQRFLSDRHRPLSQRFPRAR